MTNKIAIKDLINLLTEFSDGLDDDAVLDIELYDEATDKELPLEMITLCRFKSKTRIVFQVDNSPREGIIEQNEK